jgi:hypothetical protein
MFVRFGKCAFTADGVSCTIVDTDFEDTVYMKYNMSGGEFWLALIEVYEKRNLNVAGNFLRALKGHDEWIGWREWNRNHNPKFKTYEADIDKLLILM